MPEGRFNFTACLYLYIFAAAKKVRSFRHGDKGQMMIGDLHICFGDSGQIK